MELCWVLFQAMVADWQVHLTIIAGGVGLVILSGLAADLVVLAGKIKVKKQ